LISLFSFQLSYFDLAIVLLVALFIGMAKTGVHGAGMLAVPMLATVFGGQLSSGIMLPMLLLADVLGVWYYHRHASWSHLKILLPWALLGIIVGTITGSYINDSIFKVIMATTIIISMIIMLWVETKKSEVPKQKLFARATGVAGGFTSMVGNLAGAITSVYLLSVRLPKNVFIGTSAWFFLVINWMKVPFHVWVWHTINWNTVLFDLTLLPAIVLGAWLGITIVRSLSEKMYRWFIIVMTLVAAIGMLL